MWNFSISFPYFCLFSLSLYCLHLFLDLFLEYCLPYFYIVMQLSPILKVDYQMICRCTLYFFSLDFILNHYAEQFGLNTFLSKSLSCYKLLQFSCSYILWSHIEFELFNINQYSVLLVFNCSVILSLTDFNKRCFNTYWIKYCLRDVYSKSSPPIIYFIKNSRYLTTTFLTIVFSATTTVFG